MLTLNFFSLFDNKRKFSKKWLWWFLCGLRLLRFILFLVCVVTFCISIYVLIHKRRSPKQGSFTFLICTGGGQGTVSALLLWYWSKKGYLEKFVEIVQLSQEQNLLSEINNLKALFKIRNVCLLFFYILLVLGALYNVILYWNDTVMENSIGFMFHEDEKNFVCGIFKFLVWGAYLQNIYFFLCLTIFVTFSFVLRHEFDCVLLMMKNDSISELLYLKSVYNYHVNVCKLLQHFNIIFKRFVFLCYATNIPGLIVILYSAIQNAEQIAHEFKIGLKSSFFLTMALQLIMLSLLPASVCQKVSHGKRPQMFFVMSDYEIMKYCKILF